MTNEPEEDEDEDDGYCYTCAGTGEGQYDGASCSACGGKGYQRRHYADDDCDPPEPDYDDYL